MSKIQTIPHAIVRNIISKLPTHLRSTLFKGDTRFCPICNHSVSRFLSFGAVTLLPDSWCPVCSSLGRHRLIWKFLHEQTSFFDSTSKKVLHIAPEKSLEAKFKNLTQLDYHTADLNNPRVMHKLDVTNIFFEDHSPVYAQ